MEIMVRLQLSIYAYLITLLSIVVGLPLLAYAEDASPILPKVNPLEELIIPESSPPCEELDRPDTPAHAFVTDKGQVELIATSNKDHRQIGSSLTSLKRDCNLIFKGDQDSNPEHYNNEGWLHGTYTADGRTVYALVHNEYWGSKFFPDECQRNYARCWWNYITWAKSIDSGKTFTSPPIDSRLVAGFSYPYQINVGHPVGFMNPSNILPADGYLYAFLRGMGYKKQRSGNYLIRKPIKGEWNEWQIWDGSDFSDIHKLIQGQEVVGKPVNVGILPDFPNAAPMTVLSITKHTPTGLYVALMGRGTRLAYHQADQGFYIATSKDLINWTAPHQLLRGTFECNKSKIGPQSFYRYYSLIDPESKDRNFSTVGDSPYVYTSRITMNSCSDYHKTIRLVRIPAHLQLPLPVE